MIPTGQKGYALITALIVTAVVTALVLGFIQQVNTEQKIARNDTDYSSAFYAAEAGLEKLNSDLSKLFQQTVFPTAAQLANLQADAARPALPTVTYITYEVVGGQNTTLDAALDSDDTTATVDSTEGWPTSGFFMIDAKKSPIQA
jgi:Tfp pilus assembly protein PilX